MNIKFTKWVLLGAPSIAHFIIDHYEDIVKIIKNGDHHWWVGESGTIYENDFYCHENRTYHSEMYDYLGDIVECFNLVYYLKGDTIVFDEGGAA